MEAADLPSAESLAAAAARNKPRVWTDEELAAIAAERAEREAVQRAELAEWVAGLPEADRRAVEAGKECPLCPNDGDRLLTVGWKRAPGFEGEIPALTDRHRELPFYAANVATVWCPDCQRLGVGVLEHTLKARVDLATAIARVDHFAPRRNRDIVTAADYAATDKYAAAAVKALEGWDGKTNILLFGPVGTGKTKLATCVVADHLRAILPLLDGTGVGEPDVPRVGVVRVADALRSIKRSWDTKGKQEPTFPFERGGIMIVDDLGVEQSTEWSRERITGWFEAAYNAGTTLVVTSNFEPSELAVRLAGDGHIDTGKRPVSRLLEGGLAVEVTGPDRRLQKGG